MAPSTRSSLILRGIPTHLLLSKRTTVILRILLLPFFCDNIWLFYATTTYEEVSDIMTAFFLGLFIVLAREMLLVYYIALEALPGVLFGFSAVAESILICLGLILSLHTCIAESFVRGVVYLFLLVLSHIPILCKIYLTVYYISHPTIRHYEAEMGTAIQTRRESLSYPILLDTINTYQEPTLLEAVYREQQPTLLDSVCSTQHEDGVEQVETIQRIEGMIPEESQCSDSAVWQMRTPPSHSFWKGTAFPHSCILAMSVILLLSAIELLSAVLRLRQRNDSTTGLCELSIVISFSTFILVGLSAVFIVDRLQFLSHAYFALSTLLILWTIVWAVHVKNDDWASFCPIIAFVTAIIAFVCLVSLLRREREEQLRTLRGYGPVHLDEGWGNNV